MGGPRTLALRPNYHKTPYTQIFFWLFELIFLFPRFPEIQADLAALTTGWRRIPV
jgi:hypothetical protein